jgi:hypothetical protein
MGIQQISQRDRHVKNDDHVSERIVGLVDAGSDLAADEKGI